ncbi:hypothetical protein [Muricauda sp. NFXS6]
MERTPPVLQSLGIWMPLNVRHHFKPLAIVLYYATAPFPSQPQLS